MSAHTNGTSAAAAAAAAALHVDMDQPQPVRSHDIPNETSLDLALEWILNDNLWESAGPPKKPLVEANQWVVNELLPKLASPPAYSHPPAAAAAAAVAPATPAVSANS